MYNINTFLCKGLHDINTVLYKGLHLAQYLYQIMFIVMPNSIAVYMTDCIYKYLIKNSDSIQSSYAYLSMPQLNMV
jgi:hypothetical protein